MSQTGGEFAWDTVRLVPRPGPPPVKNLAPSVRFRLLAFFFAFFYYQQYIAKKCARATFIMLDTSCLLVQSVLLRN